MAALYGPAMTDQNALKRAVAAKALEYVQDGMKLGLGSGSTAEIFVEMLAPRVRARAEAALRADLGAHRHIGAQAGPHLVDARRTGAAGPHH